MAVSFADAKFFVLIATLVMGRDQTGQGAHFPVVLEISPDKELHHEEPGAVDANPAQSQRQ